MAFCANCGHQLLDGAKFCSNCGTETELVIDEILQRKVVYDGEIHKCPNCGEILGAFTPKCLSCGYEIRGALSANSLKDFLVKIERASSDEQRVTLIRNFPISNTKEDIFEFMILASSNLIGEFNEPVFNAWSAKFEQCYHKAKLTFGGNADFAKIQNLYDQTSKQVSKERVVHRANNVRTAISKFTATFPNPIFGIVVALLGIYIMIRIVRGYFAGLDIIMVALILRWTYKTTNKKDKKK